MLLVIVVWEASCLRDVLEISGSLVAGLAFSFRIQFVKQQQSEAPTTAVCTAYPTRRGSEL